MDSKHKMQAANPCFSVCSVGLVLHQPRIRHLDSASYPRKTQMTFNWDTPQSKGTVSLLNFKLLPKYTEVSPTFTKAFQSPSDFLFSSFKMRHIWMSTHPLLASVSTDQCVFAELGGICQGQVPLIKAYVLGLFHRPLPTYSVIGWNTRSYFSLKKSVIVQKKFLWIWFYQPTTL